MMRQIALLLALLPAGLWAAPAADYWPYWDRDDARNPTTIDHSVWDQLLVEYSVDEPATGIVRFRYGALTREDRQRLRGYLGRMAALDPRRYSRPEQKAYWMNLYNALSVEAVLEHYPAQLESGFRSALPPSIWSKERIKVVGKRLSLNDIEHRILRPLWQDHRIHFGLNCASLECPNMSDRAYTAATLEEQLKRAGRRFINGTRGVVYEDGVLRASPLFRDNLLDFADDEKMLRKVFAHYARDRKALYLLGASGDIQYSGNPRLNAP